MLQPHLKSSETKTCGNHNWLVCIANSVLQFEQSWATWAMAKFGTRNQINQKMTTNLFMNTYQNFGEFQKSNPLSLG